MINDVYDEVDKWIAKIKQNNTYMDISENSIDSNTVNISPFNYFERTGQRVLIKSKENDFYIKIYNNSFLKNIENNRTRKYQIVNRKTKDGYRLRLSTYKKEIIKDKNNLNKKDLKIEEKTNDLWSPISSQNQKMEPLDEFQIKALENSLNWPVSIITGYAGTGKSHTVKYISEQLEKKGWTISRLAPTGRASQIINGHTIHSWLEPIIKESAGNKIEIIGFKKKTMLEKECIIIDESSMMDSEIWNEVVTVWKNSKKDSNKKIILVGDPGQLEPVGEGSPFIDLIDSKKYPVTKLGTFHRNKDNSEMIDFSSFLRNKGYLDQKNNYSKIKFISQEKAFNLLKEDKNIQMITPYRNGQMGSLVINNKIKKIMNIKEKPIFNTIVWNDESRKYIDHAPIHLEDKLIICRNLWKWNITNGTIGIFKGITKIKLYDHVNNKLTQNRNCFMFFNPTTKKNFYLPNNKEICQSLELAYAITIHKSQGSEFNDIIMYLPQKWVNSKSLYTGITRSRGNLYIYKHNY